MSSSPSDADATGEEVADNNSPNAPFGNLGIAEPYQDSAKTPQPGFFSRILRSLPHFQRQVSPGENGVIPDAEVPADLDKILGPHGTLDPFGFLGPQIGSAEAEDEAAAAAALAVDPHDSPNVADDQEYDLPNSAVDEASPEVAQILSEGELDPFGQAKQSEIIEADDDPADKLDTETYLKNLKEYKHGEEDWYLGDPRDVEDFVHRFLNDGLL